MSTLTYINDRHPGWTCDATSNATEEGDDTDLNFNARAELSKPRPIVAASLLFMAATGNVSKR